MKVISTKTITSGDKNGRKWYLCAVTFEGAGEAKGFLSFEPTVGKELDVEFFDKEYNGKMEKNFKIIPKPQGSLDPVLREAIIQGAKYSQANNDILKAIAKHLDVNLFGNVANTNVPYPHKPEGEPTFEQEINPEDIPF